MVVRSGQCSEHHLHNTCHEAISVTHGKCVVTIDQDAVQLQAPHTVFIPKGTPHAVDNTAGDSDVILLITYSAGSRDYQPVS
jgi:quercetin dioxygenase-like cupin family protein